ncbi:DUF3326 domain-containing protein [Prochlorococcus marinus]|uniref:DUF3326 domain-containing protein n=1 Tax=Prochlorococcus marinus (strain MIT 9211) TaxID=93059 RepID=A9BCD5_PROM4|nr:DUF3326 domain-containing protein [Prochlorococcus marinus]ABX09497.1 conserved hypothetical protein [Prochlorococcus marinus str. MIT 9211]
MPSLLLIPSGIGCSIGGYAGDAIPTARLLAAACGSLITHPNVINGAALYWNDERIQYVEGFGIDRFACGEFLLRPVRRQKVGLLLDAGLESELRQRHLQAVDGCRATLGLSIGPVVTTDVPLGISLQRGASGASWGTLDNPDSLLRAGDILKERGATAIAVVTRFPDDVNTAELDRYRKGQGVDLMAGAEAVVSHLLTRHLLLPCAHAPALSALSLSSDLNPLVAAEEMAHTFLPCVLVGLSRAPDLIPLNALDKISHRLLLDCISSDQLGAVIATEGALGGEAVLGCLERGTPLIIVSNPGVLNVDSESLGLKDRLSSNQNLVLKASNYFEAAAFLLALREGIEITSLKRPIERTG